MKLAELQMRFQAGIVEGDNTVLASIADSRRADRTTLFAVYHDAYRLRLAEFLKNDFPVLRAHIGEEAFGRLVEDYIESAPSRQPNARWYGTRLPDFMQETAPWRRSRGAIDLARFERALSDAFDAPDAPISSIDALREICDEDWPRLAFEFQPSVRLLDLESGTAQIYAALAKGEDAPVTQQGEEAIVFWRNDG
ncbi:MAG: HvfC/BufC family peptide modification chaperone, partial [Methylocella sp.]